MNPNCKNLVSIFMEENSKLNLSAIREENDIWEKHVLDSLEIFHPATECGISKTPDQVQGGLYVLDLGTGGGFPGLPIAIENPELEVTFLDSTRKKLDAIDRMAKELEITNYKTLWGRAEELNSDPKYKGKFDIVTARAVAILPKILDWALPFLKPDGKLYLWKQKSTWDEELAMVKRKDFKILNIHEYSLPSFSEHRLIVEIQK